MTAGRDQAMRLIRALSERVPVEAWPGRAAPIDDERSPRATRAAEISPDAVDARWRVLGDDPSVRRELLDAHTAAQQSAYAANIESFIGAVRVPVGVAGPLRVRGLFAHGDYVVPMATTEAALVASYTRGMLAVSESGGATTAVVNEAIGRAPVFMFAGLADAGRFVAWCAEQVDAIRAAAEATTRHGKLIDLRFNLEGSRVYISFEYTTGDAAGQNMVTIATAAGCAWIVEHAPVPIRRWLIESNHSGDKKATQQSLTGVRGRKVIAEAVIPAATLKRRLHVEARALAEAWQVSAIGGVMSGGIGIQGHLANGLAAIFIATGQDAACVAEAAVGITRFESDDDGALHASVTLPGLIVGTVGGGTGLPSQRACLRLLRMDGPGHAGALAEVIAAALLAGEISILAAICAGDFATAHARLARERRAP